MSVRFSIISSSLRKASRDMSDGRVGVRIFSEQETETIKNSVQIESVKDILLQIGMF